MPVHLHEVDVNRTWLILHSRPRNSTLTYAQVNKFVRNNGFSYRNLSCAINLIGILVTATVLGNRPSIRQQKRVISRRARRTTLRAHLGRGESTQVVRLTHSARRTRAPGTSSRSV